MDEMRPILLAAVRRSCPRWLAEHAEDIVQEAMVKVSRLLEREGDPNRRLPTSYLKKAAYTAVIDAVRSQRTRHENEKDLDDRPIPPPDPDPGGNPERGAAAAQIGAGITDCLGRMVPPRRSAVTLHLQGHSVPETALLLNWTHAKAKNLVYRGLDNLRRCLTEKGLTP